MSDVPATKLEITYEDPGVYLLGTLGSLQLTLCNGELTQDHLSAIGGLVRGPAGHHPARELVTLVSSDAPAPPRAVRARLIDVIATGMPQLERAVWVMEGDGIGARFNRSIMRALLPLLLRRLEARLFVVDTVAAATRRLVTARPVGVGGPSELDIEVAVSELWRRIESRR